MFKAIKPEPERFVSIKWLKYDNAIITTTKRRYRGSCTVWHDADTGRRQDTFTESWLADLWTKARWDRDD